MTPRKRSSDERSGRLSGVLVRQAFWKLFCDFGGPPEVRRRSAGGPPEVTGIALEKSRNLMNLPARHCGIRRSKSRHSAGDQFGPGPQGYGPFWDVPSRHSVQEDWESILRLRWVLLGSVLGWFGSRFGERFW